MGIRWHRTVIITMFVLAAAARAEDKPSSKESKADEIIRKHVEAVGGATKIKALETLCVKGRLTQEGLELPFTLWRKRPDKNRLEVGYKGQFFTLCHNGGKTWWVNPLMRVFEPDVVPEEYAAVVRRWADFDGPLVDYKKKGHRPEYVGEEKVGGGSAHKIKLTLAGGEVWHVYIDTKTHLEVKRTFLQVLEGQTAEATAWIGDYAVVEGVKLYRVIEGQGPDGTPYTMTLSSFEANAPIDDARFEMR